MPNSRSLLPRPNLARHDAAEFEIEASYDWSEERQEILADVLDGADGFGSRFFDYSYTSRGGNQQQHRAFVMVIVSPVEPRELVLRMRYTIAVRGSAASSGPVERPVREALQHILALGPRDRASYTIDFQYSGLDSGNLWFPLPSRVTGPEGLTEIFEIRGVRAAVLQPEESETDYVFTLDRPFGERVYLSLRFNIAGAVDQQELGSVLARGRKIAGKIVQHQTEKVE